jgi:hypothetical protein
MKRSAAGNEREAGIDAVPLVYCAEWVAKDHVAFAQFGPNRRKHN